jgi:ABC-type nitrate/sulfonate/bicarbonate transport system permease component
MKTMFLGFAAAIIIAVVVGVAMTSMNTGTDQAFSTVNVRL